MLKKKHFTSEKKTVPFESCLDNRRWMCEKWDMETNYVSTSTEETKRIAAAFARGVAPGTVVALRGDLGAGKTTFVQGLLEALGADGPYVSPTFVIMKQYVLPEPSAGGIGRIYHADAYRIDDPADMEKLSFDEWCTDPEGLVLVEWPERLGDLLPANAQVISFKWLSDTEREIVMTGRERGRTPSLTEEKKMVVLIHEKRVLYARPFFL